MNDKEIALETVKNKLSKQKLEKIDIIGILVFIIYSKPLYPSNKELNSFIDECLQINIPNYILKSRSLIAARIGKFIYNLQVDDLIILTDRLKNCFMNYNLSKENTIDNKKKKRKNENDKLDAWLKGL